MPACQLLQLFVKRWHARLKLKLKPKLKMAVNLPRCFSLPLSLKFPETYMAFPDLPETPPLIALNLVLHNREQWEGGITGEGRF